MKKVELLAPAGNLERLKITLLYGADAVYLGGDKFGLRANAINFSKEELSEGCTFAHSLGKKVYLTMNIVFHEEDYQGFESYVKEVVSCGIDGVIVSDPYVIHYMKKNYPRIEVHLSTQESVTNKKEAMFYQSLGVSRIVLARELSKKEIKEIIDATGLEIEVFIHGAMCTCFSGRCALSNYVTNRDANRGGCAQICRFVFEREDGTFQIASKDLNLSKYIGDLIEIGVTSFKVEGRMRSLYYLATVIGTYREIIDLYLENKLTTEKMEVLEERLNRVANRETSSHYLMKQADEKDQYYIGREEKSNQDYLGIIIDYDQKNQCIVLIERNYFKRGDQVEIFTPQKEIYQYTIDKIYDEEMNELDVARHPEQILKLKFDIPVEKYSMIRLIKGGKEE